jgi:hypothetical protein
MQHIPDYKQFLTEGVNLKAAHLSSAEYQKAKKLKAFDPADWSWDSKSQLYDKVNESLVTEAKFFRLPNKLNAMWELKNSVDYIVGKHTNGDDYNPAEMRTIEEFIKKIKKSAKSFKSKEEVEGTIYESVVTEATDENKPYFDFLVALRDSGATNMFGASPYLQDEFGLSKSEARKVLSKWMKSFNESVVNEAKFNFTEAEIKNAAETLAKAMTKSDKVKVEVHDFEYDKGRGAGFELSYDGDKYDGGSYYIKPNGDVINAAIKGGTKYGTIKSSEKDYIKYFKANESVNESAMSELDLLAKEAKDFKSFTKEVYKEFKNLPKKADTLKWLEELYSDAINEAEKAKGDRSKLSAEIEKALKEKATESGVPIGLLRLVMRRGLDAWNSSHREGVPQVAWGYARVNAFLEKGKGTWGKADADIAKEVRDEGKAGKLPIKNPSEFTKKEREA